jgi:hypothetical protein
LTQCNNNSMYYAGSLDGCQKKEEECKTSSCITQGVWMAAKRRRKNVRHLCITQGVWMAAKRRRKNVRHRLTTSSYDIVLQGEGVGAR